MIGKTISHYKITAKIGEGGMGIVYKAQDTRLDRFVALKFLPTHLTKSHHERQRFIHEAKAVSALQHNNICTIHEIDEIMSVPKDQESTQLFICMDYYEGLTLDKLINEKPLTIEKATGIAFQIACGLSKAHEKKIIHRDIKPANIMLTDDGPLKILDFGLAKLSQKTHLTSAGAILGTVAYISPEQAQGKEVDYRTDIWSFGVVLYEMLCAKRPFTGDFEQAVIYNILNEQPVSLKNIRADIPDELVAIVDKCLMKNPDERYTSIDEIIFILEKYQNEITPIKHSHKVIPSAPKIKNTKKYIYSGSALTALILVWLAWILIFSLPAEKHIAVLPFINIGGEVKNRLYCDGLLEIITSRLTQLQQYNSTMYVIPSSEIKKKNINSAEGANENLNANLVISGSLQKRNNALYLILNLVDAKTFRQIKSDDLDINENEISSKVEEQIIDKICNMLELQLKPTLRADFFAGGTHLSDAYDYYIHGRGYLSRHEDQNNVDTAIRLFQQALNSDSLFTLAWAGLGEAYWRKYKATKDISYVEPAKASCRRAIKQNERYADVYVTCGIIYNGISEYENAIERLNQALQLDSLNGTAYWELGYAYQQIGDSTNALKTYQKAIEKRPGSWQGYSNLGYYYYINGHYKKALIPYKKVVELLPHSYLGYDKLAAMYFFMDRFSEAVEFGEKALAREPSYSVYSNQASYYYYAGQHAKSAKMYRQILRLNQNDFMIAGNLANAFRYSGKSDSAQVYFRLATGLAEQERKIKPQNIEILCALAGYYAELHEHNKALSLLRQVEEKNPIEPDIFFNIGDVYEQLGERELALLWMEKAIENGYTMAKFKYNPALSDLIKDARFQKIWEKHSNKSGLKFN